ncbi:MULTISPECIES: TolC family protein [Fusobacterium]|uniref:toxin/drug exporter TdeA n=3 Tax=Fusobacteriaceae TaxID=203492 RepID=UPI00040F24A8|nr:MULTISPECIES: TolC family protein [Fusobacterium]
MRKIIIFIALLSTIACTNTDINNSYKQSKEDFQVYQEISSNYKIDKEWWKEYGNSELNNIMNIALKNNSDLKKAAINVNKALYQANLLGADLVPSFSSSLGSSASKNIKTGGSSNINHSASISLSYELDLWRKLSNTKNAQEWEYQATVEDLEAARLSLINSVVDTYFNIVYLNDAISLLNDKIEQYEQINTIIKNKYQYGVNSELEYLQSDQSLINLKNSLLTYQNEKTQQEQSLRDLLNLKPEENIEIKTKNLLSFKDIGVNLDVPVSVIANRPDVKAYEYRLSKAFKDVKATQAKLYPSVTIQSSLSSSGNKIDNALNVPVGLASINISLPFLNWNTLKWNIKIDEASYESAKVDFEKSIITSLNEIDTYYKSYQQASSSFTLQEKNLKAQKEITKHYKNRYDNGNVEFKSWLEALVNEKDTELNVLKAKFDIIEAENKIYQAMGGKAK